MTPLQAYYTIDGNVKFCTNEKHELWINGRDVLREIDADVISLSVLRSAVVIVVDDPDLHGKSVADSYRSDREGNVFAFTHQGELAWTIHDLASPLHFPFCAGSPLSQEERELYQKWYRIAFEQTHEYYVARNAADGHFLIDLTDQRLLAQITQRS